MNVPNQILKDALALVESGWTQWAFARNRNGGLVSYSSPDACAWCASGSLNLAVERLGANIEDAIAARAALLKNMENSVAIFNDSHGKAEVVAAFKVAIKATK